jgi:transglutaminase-like putative cysteine protease
MPQVRGPYCAGFGRRLARATALGSIALCTSISAGADERTLHEYVANVEPGEAALGLEARAQEGDELAGPSSGESGPAYDATRGDGSPGEPPGRRTPSFRPDRQTELSSGLDYFEVFRPSIAPFKRVSALGAIRLDVDGKTPVFFARTEKLARVRIEREDDAPPDPRPRDRFSAELELDFSAGPLVPLPSVSPESRVLGLRTTPRVALQIERDLDDNFVARLMSPVPDGVVRVRFVTDAPRSYFASEIPPGPVSGLELSVPPLEPSIERRGLAMAKRLGLSRKSDLRTAVETLTAYFRSFEESSAPPENTGDVYVDLVRSRKGICRHRAYGFVVTAQALGIPTRFVQNEAHSWVEIRVPRAGYIRIDLGGAAHGLTAHNVADAPSYVPSQPDPLPQPASYRRSVAEAAARAKGPRPSADGAVGRWLQADADSPGSEAPQHAQNAQDARAVDPGADGVRLAAAQAAQTVTGLSQPASAASAPAAASGGVRAERLPLTIQLERSRHEALRGARLSLAGRVVDASAQGVAGLRVEAWIAADGVRQRMLLGVCVTDGGGRFETALGIPPDLLVGDYALTVLTPGNAQYAAAVAK